MVLNLTLFLNYVYWEEIYSPNILLEMVNRASQKVFKRPALPRKVKFSDNIKL